MSKLRDLEVLTNIKDAVSSKSVEHMFGIVRAAVPIHKKIDFVDLMADNAITTNELREDVAITSSETERQIIINDFPFKKNDYLVVPKVIEE